MRHTAKGLKLFRVAGLPIVLASEEPTLRVHSGR
jgi:hypothetical protein